VKSKLLSQRYEILSDPQSRETYDNRGIDGLNAPGGMNGMDPADIFAQFFSESMFGSGPGTRGPRRRRGKGEDSVIPYEVTLEDLYNGKTVRMNMEKEVLCGQCKGYVSVKPRQRSPLMLIPPRSGARGHAKPKLCATCEGKGWNVVQSQVRICIGRRL
jgi:DnaJ homolog subfamily A member 2